MYAYTEARARAPVYRFFSFHKRFFISVIEAQTRTPLEPDYVDVRGGFSTIPRVYFCTGPEKESEEGDTCAREYMCA